MDNDTFLNLATAVGADNAQKLQDSNTPISDDLQAHIAQLAPGSQTVGAALAAMAQQHRQDVESQPSPSSSLPVRQPWSFDPSQNTPEQAAVNSGIAQVGQIYSGIGKGVGDLTHIGVLSSASNTAQQFYSDYLKQMQQAHPVASAIGSGVGGLLSTVPLGLGAGSGIGKSTVGLLNHYLSSDPSVVN